MAENLRFLCCTRYRSLRWNVAETDGEGLCGVDVDGTPGLTVCGWCIAVGGLVVPAEAATLLWLFLWVLLVLILELLFVCLFVFVCLIVCVFVCVLV